MKDISTGVLKKIQRHLQQISHAIACRAWNTIQTLPLESLDAQPYLKITGIAVALADALENSNKPVRAYEVYTQALQTLQKDEIKNTLTGPERLRAVAISLKLSELAQDLKLPNMEVEKWLVWSVEELLRIVKTPASGGTDEDEQLNLPMLPLPSWITKTDVGAPLEALGSFYAKAGRIE